jgi:hypothetical protein
MKNMKNQIFSAILSIFLCATARAELKWEQTQIDLRPAIGDKQAVGHFKYENAGKTPVHFKSVHASCGCTTAQTQKDQVAPGEKGEITATFNIGDRTGLQVKTVTVQTDDPDPAHATTVLTLKTTIPQLFEIQPAVLYWQGGEEAKLKTIMVKAAKEFPVKSLKVTSSNPAFQTKVAQTGDGEFKIDVQPAQTDKAAGATITIQSENSPKSSYATVVVTPGPTPTPASVAR